MANYVAKPSVSRGDYKKSKEYPIKHIEDTGHKEYGRSFSIIGGSSYCLEFDCSHLAGGNWKIIKKRKK